MNEKIATLIANRQAVLNAAAAAAAPFAAQVEKLDEQIRELAIVGVALNAEGQQSIQVAPGMKVIFSRAATRKADTSALQENWEKLPIKVRDVFEFEAAIDLKVLRQLSEEDAVVAARYYSTKIGDVKMKIEVAK